MIQTPELNSYLHLLCLSSRCGRCHLWQFMHQHLDQSIDPKKETSYLHERKQQINHCSKIPTTK
jgi:hypothetical protein